MFSGLEILSILNSQVVIHVNHFSLRNGGWHHRVNWLVDWRFDWLINELMNGIMI